MNLQQIVITLFVLVLIAAGSVTLLSRLGQEPAEPTAADEQAHRAVRGEVRAAERDPATWNLTALPPIRIPLRAWQTPENVRVLVLIEGEGDPAPVGRTVPLHVEAYLLDGRPVQLPEAGTVHGVRNVVVGRRGRDTLGLEAGIEGIQVDERRRILVPNEQAHGAVGRHGIPPHADLVFDVRRAKRLDRKDVTVGTGPEVRQGQWVQVRYKGTLEDGSVFDEATRTFHLARGKLIQGWVLGVPGMRVGGKRSLFVPSHLGYGAQPKDGIPPHSNLRFEIELLAIDP